MILDVAGEAKACRECCSTEEAALASA
jgi:hypothetical protein